MLTAMSGVGGFFCIYNDVRILISSLESQWDNSVQTSEEIFSVKTELC